MKKIIDFLNSDNTFYKVLDILNSYGDISKAKDGFIAGGSVANTIFHLIHGGKIVINDIDVYRQTVNLKEDTDWLVEDKNKVREKKVTDWYPSTYITEDGLEIFDDNYGRIYVSESGARMRISKHSRDGIFNNIEYNYEDGYGRPNGVKPKSKELVIIEGFDLNNCKAGLDMVNGKILYTKEFVDFLKTKQIKVVNPCAPVQTTIRIYNKIKELGLYCDLEHEMRFLTVASKHLHSAQMTKIIGPETKQKYDKIKDFVENYFVLREPNNIDELPYNLRNVYYKDGKHDPNVKIWLYDSVIDFDIVENVGSINNFKRVWELLYTIKKKSEQDKINKIFYKNIFLGDMSEDTWTRRVYKDQISWPDKCDDYTEEPHYHSNRFTHQMILTKKNYHKCDFTIKHVDFIDKFILEHCGISFLLRNCETISEQYNMVKFIKSLANKEGDWIIGSLENVNFNDYNESYKNRTEKQFILKLIEDDKIACSTELNKKVVLSDFDYKNCVKELNTTIELREEGKKMGHCVGGYSNSIESGESRIFHINCDGIGSTLQISTPITKLYHKGKNGKASLEEVVEFYRPENWEGDNNKCIAIFKDTTTQLINVDQLKYGIRQHYGKYPEKGNLTPTSNNKEVAEKLIKYLNDNCLSTNIKLNFANKHNERIFV